MKKKALSSINKKHILLVFPIQNQKEPASLWSELYPRIKMRWEWDVDGDHRVSDLWILREELSRSHQVVYTKWYQNRATFFSQEAFINMMAYLRSERPLPPESREILEALEMDSPLSTKQIKEASGLQGRMLEATYNRSMKALWQRLLIVAFGEVEDSSFPSLAIGATKNLFEEHYLKAQEIDPQDAEKFLKTQLGDKNKFWLFAQKIKKSLGE
ncbi:hypothetical protein [Bdellovibrio sp. HCB2-146]|uniref:AlkZ-related protein n=1 Tax=Bdellovibrio sp. HCB2-146 TaxID=3394362 RepID=UPI0039BC70FF